MSKTIQLKAVVPRNAGLGLALLALSLGACSEPEPLPVDEPPEPQATELRDAIQAPIEKARAVEGAVQEAAERQRAEIDAAGG